MKKNILFLLFVVTITIFGCGKFDADSVPDKPAENEGTNDFVDDKEDDDGIPEIDEIEDDVEIYYIDETTGEIVKKEVVLTGDLSETIMEQLKETLVLSEECNIVDISVNELEEKMDIAVNTGFGDYIRGMGTTSSEQVIECVVRTYSEAYDCDSVKITENGNPFDTGHAVLDGYISYE